MFLKQANQKQLWLCKQGLLSLWIPTRVRQEKGTPKEIKAKG
jgi:hypothetical protein